MLLESAEPGAPLPDAAAAAAKEARTSAGGAAGGGGGGAARLAPATAPIFTRVFANDAA